MDRDIPSRVVDRLEPAQELEDGGAGVAKGPAAGSETAGEEIIAEPREVGDALTSGLFGEGRRIERFRESSAVGAGTHQGQRVDPFPGEELRPAPLGQAGDLLVGIQRRWYVGNQELTRFSVLPRSCSAATRRAAFGGTKS